MIVGVPSLIPFICVVIHRLTSLSHGTAERDSYLIQYLIVSLAYSANFNLADMRRRTVHTLAIDAMYLACVHDLQAMRYVPDI